MLKKTLCALLAALMLLPLAACSSTESGNTPDNSDAAVESAEVTETETETETELTDNLPEKNMNGWELTALSSVSSGYCVNQPEEETGELVNDAIYARNQQLMERFNFKLNIQDIEPSTNNTLCLENLKTAAAAGDDSYKLYLPYTKTIVSAATSILPWNDIPYIDYTQPWWFPSATEVFNVGGYQIALSGLFDLCVASRCQPLGFNKELYDELNFKDDLYDLVRKGTWTLDKYIEMGSAAVKDLNGDGVINDQDRISITGHWKGYISEFINGFGIPFASQDKDGYPIFLGPTDEKLVNAIELLQNMLDTHPTMYVNTSPKNSSAEGQPPFKSGGSLFSTPSIHSWLSTYRDYEWDVGIVPPPKLTAEQDRYYCQTAYGHSPTLARSLKKTDWENLGILMEAFCFNTYKELLPIYKDSALKGKAASSPDESEMMDLCWESIYYDFGVLCWESNIADKITNGLFREGKRSNISFLTELQSTLKKTEDDLRTAIAGMDQLGIVNKGKK